MVSAEGELVAGRYRLREEVGRGGSAVVHRALDAAMQREVALKRMHGVAWEKRLQRRFLEEARVLARVRHPGLLDIYDAGVDASDRPYVVSRLLSGQTLESALSRGPLDPERALSISIAILGALAVAHDRGVLHRDVKPSNIILERSSDGRERPVLLDFGIAWHAERLAEETTDGTVRGTPAYMAPEVICGERASPASDVWSVGVVLYRLLSGHHPFDAPTPLAMLASIVRDAPRPLAARAPSLPAPLAVGVDRALRPAPQRYRDARSFARALLEAAIASGVAVPESPDPRGLPEWGAWLKDARSHETTARIAAHDIACMDEPTATRIGRPPVSAPMLVVLAGLIALVGIGAALMSAPASAPRPTGGSDEQRPTATGSTPAPAGRELGGGPEEESLTTTAPTPAGRGLGGGPVDESPTATGSPPPPTGRGSGGGREEESPTATGSAPPPTGRGLGGGPRAAASPARAASRSLRSRSRSERRPVVADTEPGAPQALPDIVTSWDL